MTPRQTQNKIEELNFWLTHNPKHPNYQIVLKDKIQLENNLLKTQQDEQ